LINVCDYTVFYYIEITRLDRTIQVETDS